MYRKAFCCLLLLTGMLGGCETQQSVYNWGGYDSELYSYYRNAENMDAFMTALEAVVSGEETDRPVAPGLYAEYGYLLLINNKPEDAVIYFNKEKSAWPESTLLMDKMIAVAG